MKRDNSQKRSVSPISRHSPSLIRVYVKIKPTEFVQNFQSKGASAIKVLSKEKVVIKLMENLHQFTFDQVFDEQSTLQDVFQHTARPLLLHVLQGLNALLMVYGQTGSGKTYTMGLLQNIRQPDQGIVSMTLHYLFATMGQSKQRMQNILQLRGVLLYLDEIQDLLNPSNKDLQIREDEAGEVYVDNLVICPVDSYQQTVQVLNAGLNYRVQAQQKLNIQSSRSHIILTIYIEQNGKVSTFSLLDLAGSERLKKTMSTGIRRDESISINQSLCTLGKVVSALNSKKPSRHIPYRDSKLTRILQNSLKSNCLIGVIGTLDKLQENAVETYSTMSFCQRCQDIQQEPFTDELKTVKDNFRQASSSSMHTIELSQNFLEKSEKSYPPDNYDRSSSTTLIRNQYSGYVAHSKQMEQEILNFKEIVSFSAKLLRKMTQLIVKDNTDQQSFGNPETYYTQQEIDEAPLDVIKKYAQSAIENIKVLQSNYKQALQQIQTLEEQIEQLKSKKPEPIQQLISMKESSWLMMVEYLFHQCRDSYEKCMEQANKNIAERLSLSRKHCNLIKKKLISFSSSKEVHDLLLDRIHSFNLSQNLILIPQAKEQLPISTTPTLEAQANRGQSFTNNLSRDSVSIIKNYRQSSSIDDENMNQLITHLMEAKNETDYQQQKATLVQKERHNSYEELDRRNSINFMRYKPSIQNDIALRESRISSQKSSPPRIKPTIEKIPINKIGDTPQTQQQQYQVEQSYKSVNVHEDANYEDDQNSYYSTKPFDPPKHDLSMSNIPKSNHQIQPSEKPNTQDIIRRLTQKTKQMQLQNRPPSDDDEEYS